MRIVEGLVRRVGEGSLGISKSYWKTSYRISHSFSNSFSIGLTLWRAWKEKDGGCGEALSSTRVLSVLNEEEIQH